MKKSIFAILLLTACSGGSLDDGVDPIPQPDGIPNFGSYEDYMYPDQLGITSEALVVPAGYGIQEFGILGCDPAKNSAGNACGIPVDKIMKPRWNGPCTDAQIPGIDLCNVFNTAFTTMKPHFQGGGWTVSVGTSTSNEKLHDGELDGNALGRTDDGKFDDIADSTNLPGQNGANGKFYFKKGNTCDIIVDLDKVQSSFPTSFRSAALVRIMAHEMGHCAYLPHLLPDDCTNLMNPNLCTSSPVGLSTTQHNQLFDYRP